MGIFDNASTIMINNNEVQSIKITSNNAVLYEKPSSNDNYVLTLASNKDILSYYDSESATLTATLTNNNVPVQGETVTFKNGSTVLDTVTTDSNGEATYTYASTGAGDVSIKAECMLLQETFVIKDSIFADSGVTGTASSDWYEFTTSGTKTVGTTGTTLANSNSQAYMVYANKPGTSTDIYDYDYPFCVEFDIVDYVQGNTYDSRIQFYSSATENGANIGISQNGHYKITYDGQTRRYWIDGVEKTPYNIVLGKSRIGFVIYTNNSVTFKNFCIYSI